MLVQLGLATVPWYRALLHANSCVVIAKRVSHSLKRICVLKSVTGTDNRYNTNTNTNTSAVPSRRKALHDVGGRGGVSMKLFAKKPTVKGTLAENYVLLCFVRCTQIAHKLQSKSGTRKGT